MNSRGNACYAGYLQFYQAQGFSFLDSWLEVENPGNEVERRPTVREFELYKKKDHERLVKRELLSQGPHSHILMTGRGGGGVRRIFFGLTFWPKGIFLGRENNRGIFFGVLYFSSAQIKNNISAIYSFVFDQNQSWSWHVLAFQKINNKICWCKNTEGFFCVC